MNESFFFFLLELNALLERKSSLIARVIFIENYTRKSFHSFAMKLDFSDFRARIYLWINSVKLEIIRCKKSESL